MKKIYIISNVLLLLGWTALIPICAAGCAIDTNTRLIFFCVGIVLCLIGAMAFLMVSTNKAFWMNQETFDIELEKLKKAAERYDIAEKKLINELLKETGVHKN